MAGQVEKRIRREPDLREQGADRLRLYVVDMLHRAEALIPGLVPLESRDAAYVRISDDLEGQGLGVDRQTEDACREAGRDGVTIPEANMFSDNDISASTLSKKPRPDFERLIAYVLTGQIDRVYAYSNSRLTRRPMELEVLIQLAEQFGLTIRTAVSGDDNLNTADGRMTARIKAAVDAAEAEKTSERVKRQKQQRLGAGLPPGSRYRTFGYSRNWTPIEDESAIVIEVFDRVAGGESVNAVTNDLIARDVRRVSGAPWRYQATARMLESRIYAGRLSYKGEDAGPSTVPALVSEEVFNACQGRERKAAWNTRSGLLSGIAVCGACHTSMNRDGDAYRCAGMQGGCGNVRIKAEWLDSATEVAIWFLMSWRQGQGSVPTSRDSAAHGLREAIEVIDRRINDVQAASTSGALDLADAIPMLKALRSERASRSAELDASHVADETWKHYKDYVVADLSVKRTVIRQHLTAVMVAPIASPGRSTYDPDRIRVVTVYDGRELSGRECDGMRQMMNFALHSSPDAFDRIEVGWGESDAGTVVKGAGDPLGLPSEAFGESGLIVSPPHERESLESVA